MAEPYVSYKRAKFSTRLPTDRCYTAGHYWLAGHSPGVWRIGLTKFALRFLGELVEYDFEVQPGAELEVGQVIGWLEGFKAVTDLYCPMAGRFAGPNTDLEKTLALVQSDTYDRGWLYSVEGQPSDDCLDATQYAAALDQTIDEMTGRSA
ncbi:MAG: glycine cleavage system protein H [Phycisphaerae bacterium]